MLTDKVQRCVDNSENCVIVGDTIAAVNEDINKRTPAAKQMLAWDASKKVKMVNDKQWPTRVPYRKGDQANCLDLGIITSGLEKSVKKWSLLGWQDGPKNGTKTVIKSNDRENLQTILP